MRSCCGDVAARTAAAGGEEEEEKEAEGAAGAARSDKVTRWLPPARKPASRHFLQRKGREKGGGEGVVRRGGEEKRGKPAATV